MAFSKGQSGNSAGRPRSTQTMAKSYVPNALLALRELAQTSDSPQIRLFAAQSILDAANSRPTQVVNLTEELS